MIALDDPTSPPASTLLQAPGAFVWWYLDLLTPEGDGVVLIWSWGLPFLPGIAAAERAGSPVPAGERPALNVVVYEGGRPILYTLVEHSADRAAWLGSGEARIGGSWLRSWRDGGRMHVEARLDCPLPGTREMFRGTIRADLVAVASPATAARGPHRWTPLGACGEGTASLTVGTRRLARITGRAYHDRNQSTVPLEGLGIRRWLWGRVPDGAGERVWYVLDGDDGRGRAIGLHLRADGSVQEQSLEVRRSGARFGLFGMTWWRTLDLWADGVPWLRVAHRSPLEDGPFYLRFLADVDFPDGSRAVGVAEGVRPRGRDVPLLAPLVNMAVHRPDAHTSMWAPLFVGEHEGRFARLVASARRLAMGWAT